MVSQAVYEMLVDVARRHATTSCGTVARIAGNGVDNPHFAALVGRLLDEVNRAVHAAGRPMLSAIVIGVEGNRPGRGFFECARNLGVYRGGDDDEFWVGELNRVYESWSRSEGVTRQ